jgi:hypothetical protein
MSDMSAFHRVGDEDVETMTARQFWPRVRRLVHYDGAVRSVALAEAREQTQEQQAPAQSQTPELPQDPTPEQVRAMREAARRKRYPAEQFGDIRYVSDQEIVRKAGTSA